MNANKSWQNKVVLITGGSRGLGLALGRELIVKGARIAICSRTPEELKRARTDLLAHVPQGWVFARACDVSIRAQVDEFVRAAEEALGPIDTVINNAGIIQMGPYLSMSTRDHEEIMRSNFWGTVNVTQAVAPKMAARRDGLIVNITSVGALVPVPHLLPYAASKFAAFGFSMSLYVELSKYGVHVLTVAPWLMRTGSFLNVLLKGRKHEEFKWFNFAANAPLVSMDGAKAARKIVRAMEARRSLLVLGW
ncbi:MAG TPA: SDR family oxidoreductase, partial [Bdellovibrionales bacterium]|nr:SDR family oxidoreductase [Bdellovibrionales bacterium]